MKIRRLGDQRRLLPWYHRTSWTCTRCGCVFETEAGDDVRPVRSAHNEDIVVYRCPTCRTDVFKDHAEVDKPDTKRYTRGSGQPV